MNRYKVLIIDDHPVVCEGLTAIFAKWPGFQSSSCESVEELRKLIVQGKRYDLYILDLDFPHADAFSIMAQLRRDIQDARIIVYTMHEEPWILSKLDSTLIDGFLSKNAKIDEFKKAVDSVLGGVKFFTESYCKVKECIGVRSGKGTSIDLSDRERQVLEYLSKGFSTNEIASFSNLSSYTIKTYRRRLMRKLQARNVAELVTKGNEFIKNYNDISVETETNVVSLEGDEPVAKEMDM